MAKCYNSSEIKNLNKKQIFFDANILLYIFWFTIPSLSRQYSSIFNLLLKQKNEMFIDFIVISEVVNRAVRIEYENYLQQQNISKNKLSFKVYRNSQEGQDTLKDIYQIVKGKIINKFNISCKTFSKNDIESFLQPDLLDFSDKGIVNICKENCFVLLTNDKDFACTDLEILTSNPALLAI